MLDVTLILLVIVIAAALIFDYVNGFHDTANAIATCVSTRAMSVRSAILMAAGLNFLGAMISTKVAATIGKGIVDAANVTQMVVLAGVVGAIIWDLITWYYGLPSSSSHAIIGGIIGAVIAHGGVDHLHWAGLKKIILSLIISPVVGTVVGNAREVPCRIVRTCAGVSEGRAESIRATVPATSGDEKLVPMVMLYASV
jgi:PiT family inorganic phosphate transporter